MFRMSGLGLLYWIFCFRCWFVWKLLFPKREADRAFYPLPYSIGGKAGKEGPSLICHVPHAFTTIIIFCFSQIRGQRSPLPTASLFFFASTYSLFLYPFLCQVFCRSLGCARRPFPAVFVPFEAFSVLSRGLLVAHTQVIPPSCSLFFLKFLVAASLALPACFLLEHWSFVCWFRHSCGFFYVYPLAAFTRLLPLSPFLFFFFVLFFPLLLVSLFLCCCLLWCRAPFAYSICSCGMLPWFACSGLVYCLGLFFFLFVGFFLVEC